MLLKTHGLKFYPGFLFYQCKPYNKKRNIKKNVNLYLKKKVNM